jgi:hypothetical protein
MLDMAKEIVDLIKYTEVGRHVAVRTSDKAMFMIERMDP